jgi:hypothetical protein
LWRLKLQRLELPHLEFLVALLVPLALARLGSQLFALAQVPRIRQEHLPQRAQLTS